MWKTVKLGECCLVTDYVANGSFQSLRENVTYLDNDGYAVLVRLTDYTKGWNGRYKYVSEESYKFLGKSALYPGDLVISNVGEPGKTFLVPDLGKPMTLGPNSILVRPNEKILHTNFLKYYIDSEFGRHLISSIVSGTTQSKFNKTDFRALSIFLPPVAEQQRIVEKLDRAFAEIDEAINIEKSNINRLAMLRENVLIKKFSELDDECTCTRLLLAEVCADFSRGKSKHRPRNDEKLYGDAIPFVQTGDISNVTKYLSTYTKMYSEYGIKQSKVWKPGTVCITIAANIAELAILDMEACFPDSVIGAFPDKNITTSEYLFYLLNYYQKKIKKKGKGSAQQNINLATFADEKFPFPSIERQNQIANELIDIEVHIASCTAKKEQKVIALGSLKSATLKQALQPPRQ